VQHLFSSQRPNRRISSALALATMLLLTTGVAGGSEPLPERLLSPRQVEAISASDFQGVLESHRGKVVLVNLWATWCIPCVQELPDLNLLQTRYRDRGLVVLAVSMDDPATLEGKVRPFFSERAPDLVSYLNSEADEYAFIDPIDPEWIGALPTSFLFNRDGSLHEQHAGRLLYKDLEKEVLPLLAAPAD
jgi:thiol-disulfide isomerase/thioredoxin